MAVAFDAVGSSAGTNTTTPSTTPWLTWTHTAGTGGGTVLVALAWGSTSFPPTITSITYGGNAMTALGSVASDNTSSNGGILLYGITGGADGANTVLVKTSANPTDLMLGDSISFTGATGFGAAVTSHSNGASASATVTVSGTSASSQVFAAHCHGTNGTVTWSAGTSRFDDEASAASGASNLSGATLAGGGAGTLTSAIPSDVWGMIGVEVQAGAGGGTAAPPVRARPGKTWRRKFAHRQTLPLSPPPNITVTAGLATGTGAALKPSLSDYIAGKAGTGTGGYFTDQNGQPKFMLLEQAWALPSNAGRWNSGNWQLDIDTYMSARAGQGYTAWFGTAWSDNHVDSTALSGGRTWDGIYPITVNGTPGKITTGTETITLNNSFWTRIDYLFNSALKYGISCFLNLGMQYDFTGSPNIWFNLSTTQANTFGQLIAARYPQSTYPNVFWFFGDDGSGGQDTFFTQMMSGLATGGDTRPLVSTEQLPETDSHIEFDTGAVYITGGFGMSSSVTYNWVYTYDPTYLGVEKAYTESGTTLLPVVYGDGIWYGDNSVNQNTTDYTARRVTWWALASGVRGTNVTCGPTTGGDVWQWQANAVTDLTTDPNGTWITGHIGSVISYFTGLVNWHKLIPDTSNLLVTAGRGTRGTNSAPGFNAANYGDTDNYVAASRVSDGSLAVIYCGQHFSITIDQTKMAAGYTATWVDPWNLATQSATTGSTYSSSSVTASGQSTGNNSQGNPDWVLVLQGPATTTANAGLAAGTGAAQPPAAAITASAGPATGTGTARQPSVSLGHYRLMDGIAGRPGIGSTGTQPPASPTSYSGNYIAGLVFNSAGTVWLEGYWWYVPAGGDTGPAKFALWQQGGPAGFTQGTLVPGSVITSGTLTAGQWNFITLTTPLLLTNVSTPYVAAVGYSTTIGFPDTQHQFGTGNPYQSGITSGPLTAPGTSGTTGPQQPFSTAGADPSVTMPTTNDLDDLLWLDVQVTDLPPAGASYRLWPSRPYSTGDGTNGGVSTDTNGYTMATQFSLTQACALTRIWFYSAKAVFSGAAAVALPTRCAIWDVTSQTVVTGSDNTSVSWKKPDGTSGAAGDGWLYCDYTAAGVNLNSSQNYKAAVWYAGGSVWRTVVDQYYSATGEGHAGITVGVLTAPNAAAATPGQDSWNGPNLAWAYPGSFSNAENDWVDIEVTPGITVTAALASGTGAAQPPAVTITASCGLAAATGAALQPAAALSAPAGLASGTGAALQPAVQTSGNTTANAQLATGTGTAQPPAAAIATPAGAAAGTGAAQPPGPQVTASAGLATGTGAALQPSVSASGNTTASAQLAAGTGAAQPPVPAITVPAGLATAAGAAQAGQRTIPAGLATAAATARTPALAILAQAQAATALAAALGATGIGITPPVYGTATATSSTTAAATATSSGTASATPGGAP